MTLVNKWLNFLLRTIRDNKLGPTYTSRLLYLGSTIIYYPLKSSTNNKNLVELSEKELSGLDRILKYRYVDKVIHQSMKHLYNQLGYNFDLSDVTISRKHKTALKIVDNMVTFLNKRDNDGWRNAYNQSNEANYYPNGIGNYIDVDNIQDLSGFDQTKWTPLKYGNKIQKYLTPEWGNVLPLIDINQFIEIYNNNFVENREQDIKEILEVYDNMTDRHRVIAEYFQGGKVTPPGIWNVWAFYIAKATQINEVKFAEFLYRLNKSLFTASIVAWSAKFNKLQSRPIQVIRMLSPERNVTTWDGTLVSNKIWQPFQQSNGRTPPFPDFISGHSTFSGAASTIFNQYFGNTINNITFEPMSEEHSDMISPLLKNNYGSTVKQIFCKYGSSEVAQGDNFNKFPSCAVTINFNTWDELSELSGISRVYGGIHGNTANGIGLTIGRLIAQQF